MKIKKMTAHFGVLNGDTLELGDGLNVIYAPNESGKSTWCAFLRTMLYGLNTAQRAKAGQKPDKVKYRPWDGASMAGSLEVETEDGPVTIRRWTEKAAQPMQAFSATATGTETPVPGIVSGNAGEILTGVPREVFERSAFIRQSGLSVSSDPELEKRINAIVSAGDEDVSYTETNDRLKKWRNRRRNGKRGRIPELEAEMETIEQSLDAIRRTAEERGALEEELRRLEGQEKDAVKSMEAARQNARQRMMTDMAASRTEGRQAEEAYKQAEESFRQTEEALKATPFGLMGPEEARRQAGTSASNARELARLAAKLPPVKIAFIPLGVSLLAFLLALILPWTMECVGVGCVMALLFVVMYLRLSGMQKTKEETLADRQRILEYYGLSDVEEMGALLERYRTLWKDRERAEFRLEQAAEALDQAQKIQKAAEEKIVDGLDFQNGDNEAARAGQAVEELRRRIASLKERRAAIEGRFQVQGDPVVLESELSLLREEYEAVLRQEAALNLAMETLAEADSELQKRFSPRLAKEAAGMFGQLTGGRYDEITLARDLTAKARRAGDSVGWDLDYLSEGAKDQLYLALRLAVCRLALSGEDPCPIVLDDALVAFDRARTASALELLREQAKTRQILLFTCHEREYEYFKDDPAVLKLRLGGDSVIERKAVT